MEYKIFEKNGNRISGEVISRNRLNITITINGIVVSNPSIDSLIADGWEEYILEEIIPEPVQEYIPTLEELVEQKIRERYSINQEFEVLRKRYSDPDAFQEYYDYVEECIQESKNELNENYGRNNITE